MGTMLVKIANVSRCLRSLSLRGALTRELEARSRATRVEKRSEGAHDVRLRATDRISACVIRAAEPLARFVGRLSGRWPFDPSAVLLARSDWFVGRGSSANTSAIRVRNSSSMGTKRSTMDVRGIGPARDRGTGSALVPACETIVVRA
ncbi:uncharacterized protein LOC143153038 [Ptiloglossa arizonensis]|uniref:uncharacterized protein LOC143153038 n=1 Tax=Ptiloglossa arizonensis TaxID=3350558 RepID=UPI003FA02179